MATDPNTDNVEKDAPVELSQDQLLSAVSQLLVSTRRHQARSDRYYANELSSRIIAAMKPETQVKAAEIISRLSEPPEDILRQLIFANLDAARMIIEGRAITDAVLMEAASKSSELRQLIARRKQLSEPVVNRLLFYEETAIENALLSRPDVPLSSSRAARLISRVEPGSTLGWMLAKRTDLTPRLSLRLLWRVTGDSRMTILQRFNVDPSFAAEIFTRVLSSDSRSYGNAPLAKLAQLVSRASVTGNAPSEDTVPPSVDDLSAFRSDAAASAIQTISDRARISFELAKAIAEDVPGDPFAVLCAALGVNDKTFNRLLAIKPRKRAGTEPYSSEDRERIRTVFSDLNQSSAIAILSYWDIDLQEQARAAAQKRLEMDIADIQKKLADRYDKEEAAEAATTGKAAKRGEPAAPERPKKRFLF